MRLVTLPSLLAVLALTGCALEHEPTARRALPTPCAAGTMGCAIHGQLRGISPRIVGSTIPDISEYQGCAAFRSPIVLRLYEAGTDRQDRSAACNAARAHRLHVWSGGYAFLRPSRSCTYEADRTVAIARGVGGVTVLIADAEVPLPSGYVSCFTNRVARDTSSTAQVIYTAPGTWAGGPLNRPLWVATYGPRPGCVERVCAHVAWQFSDAARCQGLVGDCSLDSGLSRIGAFSRRQLIANYRLRSALRGLLTKHRCRVSPPRRYRHACRVWIGEGRRAARDIAAAHAHGIF